MVRSPAMGVPAPLPFGDLEVRNNEVEMRAPEVREFRALAARKRTGGITIQIPFDPSDVWGPRDRHHVTGEIDGVTYRTTLTGVGSREISLGSKSPGAARLEDGQVVRVSMWPEGPQAGQLAADIAEALAARPRAEMAFGGLATFYRKGWLRWIDATKRRPGLRAERIAEMVRLVEAGQKERPAQPPRAIDGGRLDRRTGRRP